MVVIRLLEDGREVVAWDESDGARPKPGYTVNGQRFLATGSTVVYDDADHVVEMRVSVQRRRPVGTA